MGGGGTEADLVLAAVLGTWNRLERMMINLRSDKMAVPVTAAYSARGSSSSCRSFLLSQRVRLWKLTEQ